jgi:putative ABC transport system substrate-binding protein
MRRRKFISLLGCVPATWTIAARAQQSERLRRIGLLMVYTESDPEAKSRINVLEEALQRLGWIKDRNLHIDYRWAGADRKRFQLHAADLVRLSEEVIISVSTPATQTMQQGTSTIPIIFTQVSDPVGQGIVGNTRRPGGNTTGFSNYDPDLGGKWLQLLKEAAPNVTRVAVVFNPDTAPYTALYLRSLAAAAPSIGITVTTAPVHDPVEIEAVFAKHAREGNGGLIMMTDAFTAVHREYLIQLAARFLLPAMYPYQYYVRDGGFMSYGADQLDQYRGAAIYVNRILKGENPGDLPVQAPTKYELVINLKTASALGLTVPQSLLARADEVIE